MNTLDKIVKFADDFFTLLTIVAAVLGIFNPTLFKWVLPQIPLLLGYFLSAKLNLSEPKRISIAIEVGMQNSGLTVSLAMTHFSPTSAIPAAIFSVWHNIFGSILANYCSKKETSVNEKAVA